MLLPVKECKECSILKGLLVNCNLILVNYVINPCPVEANFVQHQNIPTCEPAVQILHCDHSF